MKRLLVVGVLLVSLFQAFAQTAPFKFAFVSDTHIGSPNGGAEMDLRRTVKDINGMEDVAFAVVTGDITELGTDDELKLARRILDSLDIPYYVIPGNHDTGWSESGGRSVTTTFGYDRFIFDHNGVRFFGCPSGPYVRMSDGHVPRSAILWIDSVLNTTDRNMPLVFLNHYPLDNGLDNWYEVTDRLRNYNTISVLCGHGHRNMALDFEGLAGTMGRSNLRAKQAIGGYNLVEVRRDSIFFSERRPGDQTLPPWRKIPVARPSSKVGDVYPRPDYSINNQYHEVKARWTYSSDANVISTPAVVDGVVVFGDQNGVIQGISLESGERLWTSSVNGPVFSSPAVYKKQVIFGSSDGFVYCLDAKTGKEKWKRHTDAAVLGSPLVNDGIVYIGGSDGRFRSLKAKDGKEIWAFTGLTGPVVSTPLLYEGQIVFGAWDRHLYSLNAKTGTLNWKWNNGSSVRNYSPASCIPVAHDGVIYIVAPDRYITALDAKTGAALWRNNDSRVRESIGMSGDGRFVYGKTMQDTVVAYATSREKQNAAWKLHCGFGYEHVPSMLIEKDGRVFFGTKSGVVYAVDSEGKKVLWAHKIDNSMVNTVQALTSKRIIVSTMDGKVVCLETP